MGGPPNHKCKHIKRILHYKASNLRIPYVGKPSYLCTLNMDLPIKTGRPHCCMEALGPASNTSTPLLSSQDIPRISQDTGTVVVKTKPQQEPKPLAGSGQTVSTSCSLSCCSPPAR